GPLQRGCRILRSECITTRRVSARAAGARSARRETAADSRSCVRFILVPSVEISDESALAARPPTLARILRPSPALVKRCPGSVLLIGGQVGRRPGECGTIAPCCGALRGRGGWSPR